MKTEKHYFDGKDVLGVYNAGRGVYIDADGIIVKSWAPTGAPHMTAAEATEIVAAVETARDEAAIERAEKFAAADKFVKAKFGDSAFISAAGSRETGMVPVSRALNMRTQANFSLFDVGGVRNPAAGQLSTYSVESMGDDFEVVTWIKL